MTIAGTSTGNLTGMAATDSSPLRRLRCLDPDELHQRLDEEVSRSIRHGTPLACLLVRLDDFQQIAQEHGIELAEQALMHAGEAILAELRRFDRVGRPQPHELVVVLPGAAVIQGEAVARRTLNRLRAIKIEFERTRRPLCVSVGIAAWRAPLSAQQLIDQARYAAGNSRQSIES